MMLCIKRQNLFGPFRTHSKKHEDAHNVSSSSELP